MRECRTDINNMCSCATFKGLACNSCPTPVSCTRSEEKERRTPLMMCRVMSGIDKYLSIAQIAQSGERETEDLEVAGSIPALGIFLHRLFHTPTCCLIHCRFIHFRDWGLGFGVWGLGFGVWEIGRASCRKECRSRWSPYH